MSSTARPISPTRFAAALQSLPPGNLHSTAAEIRNSQAHLRSSNAQLAPLAAAGDAECAAALAENDAVLARMEGRVALLRAEVERRGLPWPDWLLAAVAPAEVEGGDAVPVSRDGDVAQSGADEGLRAPAQSGAGETEASRAQGQSGTLTDAQLAARLEGRVRELEGEGEGEGDGEGGVHL